MPLGDKPPTMNVGSGRYYSTRAWLSVKRRLVDRTRSRLPTTRENRRRLVKELAPGASFLDLGGMYGIHGDVAFWAEEAGASKVMLFDGMAPTSEFEAKHQARGSSVLYRQGDLSDPEDIALLGSWDVVWCAGVVYHAHDPFTQLLHLRSITDRTLLLGSHVIPEFPGLENGCIFFPGRSQPSVRAFADFCGETASAYPGMASPFIEDFGMGAANMWWGFSPSALKSMIQYAGFEITQEFVYTSWGRDYLALPAKAPTYVNKPGGSRKYGQELLAQRDPGDRPTWWDQPT